jgi:type VI protein secretion system component VasK
VLERSGFAVQREELAMRRPRLRFKVIALEALAAGIAVGLGIWVGAMRTRRAQSYRARADQMARAEQDHRNRAAGYYNRAMNHEVVIDLQRERARTEYDRQKVDESLESLELWRRMERREDLLADYYRDLARKYLRAAGRPWEPVVPDPPPPETDRFVLRRR